MEPFPKTADNFAPTEDWLISLVRFIGAWDERNHPGLVESQRLMRLDVCSNAGAQPTEIPIASYDLDYFFYSVFGLTLTLPNELPLSVATTFWISVLDLDPDRQSSTGMFWANSSQDDDSMAQWRNRSPWQTFSPFDQAFSLIGRVAPEPVAWLVPGMALIAMAILRLRTHALS